MSHKKNVILLPVESVEEEGNVARQGSGENINTFLTAAGKTQVEGVRVGGVVSKPRNDLLKTSPTNPVMLRL